jgi:hypothetical protein
LNEEKEPAQPEPAPSRVFVDSGGLSWRATLSASAGERVLEFTCLGESREHPRVVAIDGPLSIENVSDDSLRAWLASAPRLERFSD